MHAEYRTQVMKQLRDDLVRFSPRPVKLQQLASAEQLLGHVDPDRTYSVDWARERLTGSPAAGGMRMTLSGEDLQHDLRLLVEDVSDSADLDVREVGQPVYTVEELSQLFNVSTKTISRWRAQGLASRRFLFGGRKRVGFLQSSVDLFVARNAERVRRGERFSHMTDHERGEIIQRARRLARAGASPSEVTRQIAAQMNRSVETIRYTLKQFDQEHPQLAIFPERTAALTDELRRQMLEQFRHGTPVGDLAQRYGRTKSSVYRIIGEMRTRDIMQLPLDYIDHESFHQTDADQLILTPLPAAESRRAGIRIPRPPSGLPPYLASLYEVPLLTREQEEHLFRKLNYLKYKAAHLREKLDPARPKNSLMDQIEQLYEQAVAVKNQIVQANLRLVVSIAKRYVSQTDDFFSLVSDGNISLIRAVEKFDFSRGNKFSTYASWAIMKNFARTIPHEFKHRDRFRTSYDDLFLVAEDERTGAYEQETAQKLRRLQIGKILSRLDEREQQIIISRFGLDHHEEPQTLKEVGARLGVTKERIRQLEARALSKLRAAAREEKIELPE